MKQQVVRGKLVNLRVKHRLKKGHLKMGKNEKKKGQGEEWYWQNWSAREGKKLFQNLISYNVSKLLKMD